MKVKVGNSETSSYRKGFIPFIRFYASQIHEGGWPILLRKARSFLKMLLLMPLMTVVLILYALRPLVLIRFGQLRSERIGHFAANTEVYLCKRDAGLDNQRAFDIFYHRAPACNQQLKKMWDRTLHVSRIARPMYFLNRNLPGGASHVIPWPEYGSRDIRGLLPRSPVHLSFTPEEERIGNEGLQALGIPEGTPFICFHSRDREYLSALFPDRISHGHDYRDSSIHNHIPAAEEMTRRGYFAIRMGAVVKETLATTNPMIIDYATNFRSDFMDIYLCAKCHFYIGDDAGLNLVPFIFRRPVAYVNQIPIQTVHTWGPDHLSIPKKLWLRKEHRFLTLREIFDWEVDDFRRTQQFEQAGIEPVENTPEEITALAMEMDERLKGTWQTTEEDEELQRRFWSLFRAHEDRHGIIVSRIGAEFLRQNQEFLD
ncbi:TIGR04372 family glycosyltransferase [Chloroflexota bacterium]